MAGLKKRLETPPSGQSSITRIPAPVRVRRAFAAAAVAQAAASQSRPGQRQRFGRFRSCARCIRTGHASGRRERRGQGCCAGSSRLRTGRARVDCKPRRQRPSFALRKNQRRRRSPQARIRSRWLGLPRLRPWRRSLRAPASSSMSSGSGFFSNIFGGGSSPPAPAARESAAVTTASTAHVEPETSSWSNSTVVTGGKARPRPDMAQKAVKQHTQTAAIAPIAPPIRAAKACRQIQGPHRCVEIPRGGRGLGAKTRRPSWRRSCRTTRRPSMKPSSAAWGRFIGCVSAAMLRRRAARSLQQTQKQWPRLSRRDKLRPPDLRRASGPSRRE